jgi:hypothetical protein
MVTTILNEITGEILYSTDGDFELKENEVVAPFAPKNFFVKGCFDFKNEKYFETANETPIIKEQTKEDLIQIVQSLEQQLNEVKLQLNELK